MTKKKPNKALMITLYSVLGVLVLCVTAGIIGAFIDQPGTPSNSVTSPATTPTPVDDSSLAAAMGIPPVPDADTWKAYIADLKKINPEIVGSKDERTIINRGRDTCSSIFNWPDDHAKQVDQTNVRFTSPQHPDGFGAATAEKILAVAHARICPSY